MKKQIFPIIIIIIAILLMTTGVIISLKEEKEIENKPTQDGYNATTNNSIKVCLIPECIPEFVDNYAKISHTYDSKVLQGAIKKINDTTNDYYKEVISTNMDDASCEILRDKNKHSLRVISHYNSYTTDKVITVAVQRTKMNICTNEITPILTQAYVYDIENDKILTIKQTKELLGITDQIVYNSIHETNTKLSEIEKVQITTPETFDDDEIAIYYGTDSILYVEYFIEELNTYYQAPLEID